MHDDTSKPGRGPMPLEPFMDALGPRHRHEAEPVPVDDPLALLEQQIPEGARLSLQRVRAGQWHALLFHRYGEDRYLYERGVGDSLGAAILALIAEIS
jgi:hypothetical protein